jgi:hypothetical protein
MAPMRLAAVLLVVAACSSPQTQIEIQPPPPPETRATLAGPLCASGTSACTCRDENAAGDGGAGLPDVAGRKRFELRLGPTDNDLWVTVDDNVLYKSKERATECFYLDLPSGDHKVRLRAHRPNGLQASVAISEYGVYAKSWYKTLRFSCGVPGTCSHDELEETKAQYRAVKAGTHDPCGSVRIKNVGWDTGVAPDQLHPEDLVVELTLDIYKFKPGKPSGDPACGTGDTTAPDEPPPDEPAADAQAP